MYRLNARDHFNCSPPFLMTSTTKQMRPNGKGEIHLIKVTVKVLDIAPLRESSPQKRSGMARVLKGSRSFSCTTTGSSAIGMSHICRCLPRYSWYSFTDPGGMEGRLGLGGWIRSETVYLPEGRHSSHY